MNKTSIYFKRKEFISRIKLSGQKYLHRIEIDTNLDSNYVVGEKSPNDYHTELAIPEGQKVISFEGVMEVMAEECRLLNLAISSKDLYDEC